MRVFYSFLLCHSVRSSLGGGHSQESWLQLAKGKSHSLWCHASNKSSRKRERREVIFDGVCLLKWLFIWWCPAFQGVAKHLTANKKQWMNALLFPCLLPIFCIQLSCLFLNPQLFSLSFYFLPILKTEEQVWGCMAMWQLAKADPPWEGKCLVRQTIAWESNITLFHFLFLANWRLFYFLSTLTCTRFSALYLLTAQRLSCKAAAENLQAQWTVIW